MICIMYILKETFEFADVVVNIGPIFNLSDNDTIRTKTQEEILGLVHVSVIY